MTLDDDARRPARLTREEELDLVRRMKEGDRAALSRLVTSHMGFVRHIARRYRKFGHPAGELLQEGAVGLMEAVRRFNPERGVRLSTYAMWWIRAAIQDYVIRSRSLVRMGTTSRQKSMFFALWRRLGKSSAISDEFAGSLARRFNVSVGEVRGFARRIARADRSLEEPSAPGSRERLIDQMPDSAPNPEEATVARAETRPRLPLLARALKSLPARERHIIRRRFFAEPGASRATVGAELGLSKERIRQLELRALGFLRRRIEGRRDGETR